MLLYIRILAGFLKWHSTLPVQFLTVWGRRHSSYRGRIRDLQLVTQWLSLGSYRTGALNLKCTIRQATVAILLPRAPGTAPLLERGVLLLVLWLSSSILNLYCSQLCPSNETGHLRWSFITLEMLWTFFWRGKVWECQAIGCIKRRKRGRGRGRGRERERVAVLSCLLSVGDLPAVSEEQLLSKGKTFFFQTWSTTV